MQLYLRLIWYDFAHFDHSGPFPYLHYYLQHAHAVEYLLPFLKPGSKVLDVGSGSGYLVAVLHHVISSPSGVQGKVVGIDHIPELVKYSVDNLKKDGLGVALDDSSIIMVTGDGRQGTY